MPDAFEKLRAEVGQVIDHFYESNDKVALACNGYPHPRLAALSVMCQMGEREDRDRCIRNLPERKKRVHGYLGDNFLCDKMTTAEKRDYINLMEAEGIIDDKSILECEDEHLTVYEDK